MSAASSTLVNDGLGGTLVTDPPALGAGAGFDFTDIASVPPHIAGTAATAADASDAGPLAAGTGPPLLPRSAAALPLTVAAHTSWS